MHEDTHTHTILKNTLRALFSCPHIPQLHMLVACGKVKTENYFYGNLFMCGAILTVSVNFIFRLWLCKILQWPTHIFMSLFSLSVLRVHMCLCVSVALFEAVTKSHTHALSTAFSGQFLFSLLSMLAFCASLVCEFIETRKCPAVPCLHGWLKYASNSSSNRDYLIRLLEFCHARSPFTGFLSLALTHACTQSPHHTHVAHINIENAS